MIGPTGVGKTEIARRLAKLADAPFIKVEATKFTEVGYVGKDVDSIVRDLVDMAIKQEREVQMRRQRTRAEDAAEERVLDILVPGSDAENNTRQLMRKRLREGTMDDKEIEVDLLDAKPSMEILTPWAALAWKKWPSSSRACSRRWAAANARPASSRSARR